MHPNLAETLRILPFKLGKATITIERCNGEDSVEIRLDDREIYTSEYAKQLIIDGVGFDMENPFKEIIRLVKEAI